MLARLSPTFPLLFGISFEASRLSLKVSVLQNFLPYIFTLNHWVAYILLRVITLRSQTLSMHNVVFMQNKRNIFFLLDTTFMVKEIKKQGNNIHKTSLLFTCIFNVFKTTTSIL